MSLRSRLFLWISALLLTAGATSYFLEVVVTEKELKKTKEQLRQKIEDLNQYKKKQIEYIVASNIQENQARIDVLLERLSSYPLQSAAFAPTQSNQEQGTWLAASEILLNNQWLDFIQNTNQGALASLIIPKTTALNSSSRVLINEDLAWIALGDPSPHPEPYLGIRARFVSVNLLGEQNPDDPISTALSPQAYLLFNWKDLKSPDPRSLNTPIFKGEVPPIQTNVPWMEGVQLDLHALFASFQDACQYVKAHAPPSIEDLTQHHSAPSSLQDTMEELVAQYDQRYLIWGLSFMHAGQIFGKHLLDPPSPQGIALYFGDALKGEGLEANDLFFSTQAFNDKNYYQQHMPPDLTSHLGSHIAVFQPFDLPQLYLGNTAQYRLQNHHEAVGYLTLAINTDHILQKIALAMNQTALIVHQGKITTGLTPKGQTIDSYPSITDLSRQPSGIIEWNNESYYFLQTTPLPDLDFHIFLLNPAGQEFALLNSLNEGAASIIHKLLNNIHIVGFSVLFLAILILHYLSRRITQPITRLATAASHIKEGNLDDLEIPVPSERDTDEVAALCRSFHQMVIGLKEKEKVKAVLNKVVSQEIAQEILKGNIHLGGEEKKVTVLFADIRGFTNMTQNMDPKDVVELLNGCMTKISLLVDQHRGVIDKYVGDAAMALFGAPLPSDDSAHEAIVCALGMCDALNTWNIERISQGLLPVKIGIGIHTGTVLAGNMGAENRLNYTVLGSNVNFAARLCSAAQPMEILISEATLQEPHITDHFLYEKTEPMNFKGFDLPVIVYRIQGVRQQDEA